MNKEQDYIKDIAEMRALMERSTKFLSLSGMAGVLAGIYALLGAYIAHQLWGFPSGQLSGPAAPFAPANLSKILVTGATVLILAVLTAIVLSWKNAKKRKERLWNPVSRQLAGYMLVPLVSGGLLILICISKGLTGLILPLTLLFYGLALYGAGKFTYREIKSLGLIQILLGLLSACFESYALLLWALGFGLLHIIYGIYMHYRHER